MTNTVKNALAVVTLAAAALALPTAASAGDYRKNCADTENAILGGVVGGSLGTVIGEEIAGRGDKTEGAVLGAIIGGIAGAAIGDGANDCEKYDQRRKIYTNHNRGYRTAPVVQKVHHRGGRGYGYNHRSADPLWQVDREIEALRRERKHLKRERQYSRGYRPGIERRLDRIAWRLDELKRERKRIKRFTNQYGNSYGYRDGYHRKTTRRGHYHGNSRNLCYSDH